MRIQSLSYEITITGETLKESIFLNGNRNIHKGTVNLTILVVKWAVMWMGWGCGFGLGLKNYPSHYKFMSPKQVQSIARLKTIKPQGYKIREFSDLRSLAGRREVQIFKWRRVNWCCVRARGDWALPVYPVFEDEKSIGLNEKSVKQKIA